MTEGDSYNSKSADPVRFSNTLKFDVHRHIMIEKNTNSTHEASDRPYINRSRPGMTENNFWGSQTYRLAFVFYVDALYRNGFVESVWDAWKYSCESSPSPKSANLTTRLSKVGSRPKSGSGCDLTVMIGSKERSGCIRGS